jgi:hypothetical protein
LNPQEIFLPNLLPKMRSNSQQRSCKLSAGNSAVKVAGKSPGIYFPQMNPQEIPQELIFRRKLPWIFCSNIIFYQTPK